MSRAKLVKRLRKYHQWLSIVLSIFTLIFALSGIVLNHREWFSGLDVNRSCLLSDYQYNYWNNAAIKSACVVGADSLLVYGNIGVWLTDSLFNDFKDFNSGFPAGIDNRKIYKIHKSGHGYLYAATLFGLYHFENRSQQWQWVNAPFNKEEVVDLFDRNDSLYVLTRSFLFVTSDEPRNFAFRKITLPPPVDYDYKEGLFKTLWVIHSGEIGGLAGKLLVDLIALIFIFLTLTGLIYWIFPKWIKQRKRKAKPFHHIKQVNQFSLKWHNKLGVWVVVFLLVTTLTGMFLRPPLLITIANASVSRIPFTLLDTPNPWYDKLRRIIYDEDKQRYLIGTNQGIYYCDREFNQMMIPFRQQPPVSVMGINVFEQLPGGNYLVGSFSGLFLWQPDRGQVINFLHPEKSVSRVSGGPPLGDEVSAGLIRMGNNRWYHFDYGAGAQAINTRVPFPEMPDELLSKSPMSLWNLALEFHTARYYQMFFGDFYILFIPLYGLSMIIILITGFWIWWKVWRPKKRSNLELK